MIESPATPLTDTQLDQVRSHRRTAREAASISKRSQSQPAARYTIEFVFRVTSVARHRPDDSHDQVAMFPSGRGDEEPHALLLLIPQQGIFTRRWTNTIRDLVACEARG